MARVRQLISRAPGTEVTLRGGDFGRWTLLANRLTIRGEKGDTGFFDRMFGSNPSETVTLKLPRRVSLETSGVNGAVNVGDLDGSIEVSGVATVRMASSNVGSVSG